MNKVILAILSASLSFMATAETYQVKVGISTTIENSVFAVAAPSVNVPDGEDVDEITFIQETIGISNWELCFDSDVDGHTQTAYHTGCDGKGATVFIAEYNDTIYGDGINRFAGYTTIDSGVPDGGYTDPDATLFDLLKSESFTTPANTVNVVVASYYGPLFDGSSYGGVNLITDRSTSYPYGNCGSGNFTNWTSSACSGGNRAFQYDVPFKVYAVN
jgi:hypothetical protein